MRVKFWTVFVISLFNSNAVQATCYNYGCDDTHIEYIYVQSSGNIKIKLIDAMSNANCTLSEGSYFVIRSTDPARDVIYSALFTNKSLGKKIKRIRIIDSSTDCAVNYIFVE